VYFRHVSSLERIENVVNCTPLVGFEGELNLNGKTRWHNFMLRSGGTLRDWERFRRVPKNYNGASELVGCRVQSQFIADFNMN
jgi:hypothetical protein